MTVLNRGTGLLIIEVRCSNPNGDPDAESEPRTLESDGRGLISPVSFKRKLRDLVGDETGPAWEQAQMALQLQRNGDARRYRILEERGRDRAGILAMDVNGFTKEFWDARVFGNTTLEEKMQVKGKEHFISTGVTQFGPGISVSPIEIERLTMTKKAEAQAGKDRGMAPLGWRVVRHAVYSMPFFVNPMAAGKTGCGPLDIDLLKFLIPQAYRNTASAIRPFVEIRHAWYAEHKSPLGSCPDSLILDALTPRKVKGDPEEPSRSIDEYEIPANLPENIRTRLASFEDLCLKAWN
jgi:Cas7 group CRISPR-associated protein Csh2